MIRKLCCAVLFLGMAVLAGAPAVADDGREAATKESAPAVAAPVKSPPYRPYFYNYPHEIPADYVFRTERVFSPQGMGNGLLSGLTGGVQLPAQSNAALAGAVRELAKKLLVSSREEIADEYVVAVSTFVNLNNLYATSALGRYVGEQMISELQNSGVEVVDVRKTPGIMVSKEHGEYSLSRDMKELGYIHNAQAMVVGTYTVAEGRVFLNARLLRNEDNLVLAAATLEVPMDGVVAGMLADEGMPVGRPAPVAVRTFGKR